MRTAILILYFAALGSLALFGVHRWFLVFLYLRHRPGPEPPEIPTDKLPQLTVQLPIYNELYVAERLILAVAAFDWPHDRLEIQVLDDSTDETTARIAKLVERLRGTGLRILHLRRESRDGFKAGALAAGLRVARGDWIAVFDADFVPPPDLVRRLAAHLADPRVGMVQARWGHLNADHSALTQAQALFLDGHFVVEQTARCRSGRFFNFNGTAGIWRRTCIEDAGGWQADTLTEDLDISYRAQLAGWKFVFLPRIVAPAELPVEIGAFKAQQHRWAKGSIQTARKLLPSILSSHLPLGVKIEAAAHLLANLGYLLMVLVATLVVPAVWIRRETSAWELVALDLPLFALSTLSVVAFYLLARHEAEGHARASLRWIPVLMAVGIGLSLSNARAVVEALVGHRSGFQRTPKLALGSGEPLSERRYRTPLRRETWVELVLAVHFCAGVILAGRHQLWGAIPFLAMFAAGYAYTGLTALAQRRSARFVVAAGL